MYIVFYSHLATKPWSKVGVLLNQVQGSLGASQVLFKCHWDVEETPCDRRWHYSVTKRVSELANFNVSFTDCLKALIPLNFFHYKNLLKNKLWHLPRNFPEFSKMLVKVFTQLSIDHIYYEMVYAYEFAMHCHIRNQDLTILLNYLVY